MDTITFGAFARSGNHYFQYLVETALVDVRCDWLSHRIGDWDNKPNCVTVVRNPLDCVSSWVSTGSDQRENRAEKVLEWYIAYHKTILSKDIMILTFEELISDSLGSINKVCNKYGINKSVFFDNNALGVAMGNKTNFVNANYDKSDYPVINAEICSNGLYSDAVKLFEELCVHAG